MQVTIHNDRGVDLTIKQCDVTCHQTHEEHKLSRGQSIVVNTSYAGVANYWLVSSSDGQVLGCLDLLFKERQDNVTVEASSAKPCPK